VTERQRQVFEAWCAGEPVADTCDRLRISRQRYYQLLRAALAEEQKKEKHTGRRHPAAPVAPRVGASGPQGSKTRREVIGNASVQTG
jgi:hypothetical protein